MAIYNFGSVNIDHVYSVEHFVQPGETLSSSAYSQLLGGKGANQSVALAKAGATVHHVGCINKHDTQFKQQLIEYGVQCQFLLEGDIPSGHAIIQVTPDAENAIVLFGGANQQITDTLINDALSTSSEQDWVLLQNETNALAEIITTAKQKGLSVAFNPAPMTESVKDLPFDQIDLLIVNEVEAQMLTGESELSDIIDYFNQKHSAQDVIITLGKKGVCMLNGGNTTRVDAFRVNATDTTAAGDTFIGFFLASYINSTASEKALVNACAASAISVTQSGAAQSIPTQQDVEYFLQKR
ncbi:ribokinase [Alteromonas sp. 5E99-2]|uniref:ribokinase n=1 Tax=Alteromonas sp. 5E99-2 TaxID=2817683 RepID=UPI001A99560B|nr:ribokinase [Alteromonas sp. 5E99-2]MBO1256461.1 ribokinase [Alteromonas sp. 5E99-2]